MELLPQLKGLIASNLNPNYFAFLLFLLWLLISFILDSSFYFRASIYTSLVYMIIAYMCLIPFILGINWLFNRYLVLFSLFFFPLLATNFYTHINVKIEFYKVNKVLYYAFILTCLTTLYNLVEDGNLSRNIKSSGIETIELWNRGIGGYSFIYFGVFVAVSLMFIISTIKMNRILNISFYLANIIIVALMIIYSNYLTAIFMILISLLALSLKSKMRYVLYIVFPIYLIFGIANLIDFKNEKKIGELLTDFLPEGLTKERINTLISNEDFESIDSRKYVKETSFNLIYKYPIFGVLFSKESGKYVGSIDVNSKENQHLLGNHSLFLDTISLFGIFVGISLFFIIFFYPLMFLTTNYYNSKALTYNITIIILLLIMFYNNNLTSLFGYFLFLLFPMVNRKLISNSV